MHDFCFKWKLNHFTFSILSWINKIIIGYTRKKSCHAEKRMNMFILSKILLTRDKARRYTCKAMYQGQLEKDCSCVMSFHGVKWKNEMKSYVIHWIDTEGRSGRFRCWARRKKGGLRILRNWAMRSIPAKSWPWIKHAAIKENKFPSWDPPVNDRPQVRISDGVFGHQGLVTEMLIRCVDTSGIIASDRHWGWERIIGGRGSTKASDEPASCSLSCRHRALHTSQCVSRSSHRGAGIPQIPMLSVCVSTAYTNHTTPPTYTNDTTTNCRRAKIVVRPAKQAQRQLVILGPDTISKVFPDYVNRQNEVSHKKLLTLTRIKKNSLRTDYPTNHKMLTKASQGLLNSLSMKIV